MSNYRQLFKSTGLLGSVQALYILISVVRNKVAAQLIGAVGMGLADLYARSLDLLGGATNFGLGMSGVKRLSALAAEEHADRGKLAEEVKLLRTWVVVTALLGAAVCLVFSPLISLFACDTTARTGAFCLLAPAVAMTTLAGGEIAILKSLRHLKRLARATLWNALFTLCGCWMSYALWGLDGVLPMLVAGTASLFGFHLREAWQTFPYKIGPLRRDFLRPGWPLVKMGAAYVMAGVTTAATEMLIRAALMRSGAGLMAIGYYAAGFTLTVSYARMVFVAMDADYFPRLSAIPAGDLREQNVTINRQINTLIVLMAPFLMVFCLFLPWIIQLLYTRDFLAIQPMVLCAAPFMYFKAIYAPVAYLALARGHSVRYMTMELIYDVVLCVSVIVGYYFGNLTGAGLALALANFFDLVLILTCYRKQYGFRISRGTRNRAVALFVLLAAALCAASQPALWLRFGGGALCLALTLPYLWPVLRKVRR